MNGEVYFWLADKHRSALQVDTIMLGVRRQACPRTQNKKFALSLQYLQKNVGNEVNFLLAEKRKSFLQVDSTTSGVCNQAC